MVAQVTVNHLVAGSNPAFGANFLEAVPQRGGTASIFLENGERKTENGTRGKRATGEGAFQENMETQGMGTVVRPAGPNGEVPRPLRSLCVFVENSRPDMG